MTKKIKKVDPGDYKLNESNPDNYIKVRITNYDKETPELKEEFKRLGLQAFDSLHFQYDKIEEGDHWIEKKHMFGNQYNTRGGFRIFEKCTCLSTPSMKKLHGYYISEGIEDVRAYQATVKTCGYCGKQYVNSRKKICSACLGSEYLEESDLPLLKLAPVYNPNNKGRELTKKELSSLLVKYHKAQGLGKISRAKKLASHNRKKVASLIPKAKEKAAELIEEAKIKTAAHTWLLDNKLNILGNVIYYTHTKRFCFGWRKPITGEEKSKLLDVLCEFPFDYDVK